MTVPELASKLPVVTGTSQFITGLTTAHQLYLAWATWVQWRTPYHVKDGWLYRLDDGNSKNLRNASKLLPDYTALQRRTQTSLYSLSWEPKILLVHWFLKIHFYIRLRPSVWSVPLKLSNENFVHRFSAKWRRKHRCLGFFFRLVSVVLILSSCITYPCQIITSKLVLMYRYPKTYTLPILQACHDAISSVSLYDQRIHLDTHSLLHCIKLQ
jgi:hypothetical protein